MTETNLTIMGGGFAGMLTAICLSPHVEQITLLDRHPYSTNQSRGMPQSEHLHVMMAGGQELFKMLMPNVWQCLMEQHLPQIDWAADTLWHTPHGRFPNYESKLVTYLFSRNLLNQLLFDELNSLTNVRLIHSAVKGVNAHKGCIDSIIVDDSSQIPIHGMLIDARGRGSHIARELGPSILQSRVVKNNFRYYSTKISTHSYHLNDMMKQAYIQADQCLQETGLVLSPIENNQAILTLIETDKAKKMDNRACQAAVTDLFYTHNLGQIELGEHSWYGFNNLTNRRLYFAKNQRIENLVIIGDALCYQNPVYGQGMTVVLHQVRQLKKAIIGGACIQQADLEKLLFIPWLIASNVDQKYNAEAPLRTRLFNRSFEKLLKAGSSYPWVHRKLLQVLHQVGSARADNKLTVNHKIGGGVA